MLKIGANTTIGMVAAAAASGVIISSAIRNRATSDAAMTASTVPISRPTSALAAGVLGGGQDAVQVVLQCRVDGDRSGQHETGDVERRHDPLPQGQHDHAEQDRRPHRAECRTGASQQRGADGHRITRQDTRTGGAIGRPDRSSPVGSGRHPGSLTLSRPRSASRTRVTAAKNSGASRVSSVREPEVDAHDSGDATGPRRHHHDPVRTGRRPRRWSA